MRNNTLTQQASHPLTRNQTEREILNALNAAGFSFEHSQLCCNARWEAPNGQFLVYWETLADVVQWASEMEQDSGIWQYIDDAIALDQVIEQDWE